MARTDTLPHFLTDVADAIRTKSGTSGTIQASTFDTAIANIPSGGGSGWQRPSDWWDIKTILDNAETRLDDNGNTLYPVYAVLMDDWNAISGYAATKADGILTSDGTWYGHGGVIHTWDPSYDKPCSEGYKTRYIIVYQKSRTYTLNDYIDLRLFRMLEIYIGNFKILSAKGLVIGSTSYDSANKWIRNIEFSSDAEFNSTQGTSYSWHVCKYCPALEHVNYSTTTPLSNAVSFSGCMNLKEIEGSNINASGLGNFNNCYSLKKAILSTTTITSSTTPSCYALEELYLPNLTTISGTEIKQLFCLKKIEFPNLTSITASNLFAYCYALNKLSIPSSCTTFPTKTSGTPMFGNFLQVLDLPENFAISGLDLTDDTRLTHSCLVDIMNKLKDVTGESGTYTLTLGESHIGRLSADELAIGTNKGWIIN